MARTHHTAPARVDPRRRCDRLTSPGSERRSPISQRSIWRAFACSGETSVAGRLPPICRSLARILAYRLQADAFGDLPDTVRRTLEGFGARGSARGGQASGDGSSFQRRIKPGSILVREWDGRLHRVMALEEGFAWEGKTYRSLSKVARAITGGHWNGPRFFGLTGSRAMARAAATIASTALLVDAGLSATPAASSMQAGQAKSPGRAINAW